MDTKATISIVFSVYNEEARLQEVLSSSKWADEVLVVDNSSTDRTSEIAKKLATKVLTRPNNPMLNVNKNYGIDQAKSNWILYLDGDEEISTELKKEIIEILKREDDVVGYWIPRKNIIFGKWIRHGLWWPDKQMRLFKRGVGRYPEKHVHEYIAVEGKTSDLTEPLVHHNYQSVSQFLTKLDTLYTPSEVAKLQQTYELAWYDAIRFPMSDFVKIYFAQQGYKDGLHGLVLSLLQAFYSLVVFAKLWESRKFPERDVSLPTVRHELKRANREMQYWLISTQLKENKNPFRSLWLKIARHYVS